MRLELEEVTNAKLLESFVNLPFSLYDKSSLWTPDLKKQTRHLLDPARHPFWKTASRKLFLAKLDGQPAGRIAAIIDRKYNEYARQACGAFGFFECVDNRAVAHALLDRARAWLRKSGMLFMRGPLNPSTNYTCGLLVDGFDLPPTLMMPWNPPYYARLLESWILRKEQDLFAYTINKAQLSLPDWLSREISRLEEKNLFTFRASSKATLKEDTLSMLEIYKTSWADNWGFSPLSPGEEKALVKELTAILDPRFFVLFFHEGRPVAGMVALPDLNPLLKRFNGSINLLAPWHYWKARKDIRKGYRLMLFGILPKYRLYGLPVLLLDYMLKQAVAIKEFEWVEGSWVLEDNAAIDDLIEDFGGVLTKRYRIYRREIAVC